MKIMPLTIINIFAVMEIIGLANQSVIRRRRPMGTSVSEVIYLVWIASPQSRLAMTSLTGTIYFLAMIMAESLFSVFGIILISAFYLIEKLKK